MTVGKRGVLGIGDNCLARLSSKDTCFVLFAFGWLPYPMLLERMRRDSSQSHSEARSAIFNITWIRKLKMLLYAPFLSFHTLSNYLDVFLLWKNNWRYCLNVRIKMCSKNVDAALLVLSYAVRFGASFSEKLAWICGWILEETRICWAHAETWGLGRWKQRPE